MKLDAVPLERLCETPPGEYARLAVMLGVTRRTWQRWKRDGLTQAQADRAAQGLDMHPTEIWGLAYYNADPGGSNIRQRCRLGHSIPTARPCCVCEAAP